MTDIKELNAQLRELSNGVVGMTADRYVIEGVKSHVEVTFDCEHDIVAIFVFPESGEPFAQFDYGYFPNSTRERLPILEAVTAHSIWQYASENELYPFDIEEDDTGTHESGVKIAILVNDYISSLI